MRDLFKNFPALSKQYNIVTKEFYAAEKITNPAKKDKVQKEKEDVLKGFREKATEDLKIFKGRPQGLKEIDEYTRQYYATNDPTKRAQIAEKANKLRYPGQGTGNPRIIVVDLPYQLYDSSIDAALSNSTQARLAAASKKWFDAKTSKAKDSALAEIDAIRKDVAKNPYKETAIKFVQQGADNAIGGSILGTLISQADHLANEQDRLNESELKYYIRLSIENSGKYIYKNGTYENADYHGKSGNSVKSKAPQDGQFALDNSVEIKGTTDRRVGIDVTGDYVVLDKTVDGTYHGHVRPWKNVDPNLSPLTDQMKNALRKEGYVKEVGGKGKLTTTAIEKINEFIKFK